MKNIFPTIIFDKLINQFTRDVIGGTPAVM